MNRDVVMPRKNSSLKAASLLCELCLVFLHHGEQFSRVRSLDRKSLQKTLANTMEMCDLAKGTIDMVEKKKWLDSSSPAVKRSRLSSQ